VTRPAAFSGVPIGDAISRAAEEKRLLVVDFTAEWCQPCKLMDRITWSAPDVAAWIGEHAVAVQIDVDADQELARTFGIRAMPTIVVLRGDTEIDRATGLKKADELLAWLGGLLRGDTSNDQLHAAIAADPNDVRARFDLAGKLVADRNWPAAADQLAWLWEHAVEHDPAMVGVRNTFLVELIREAAAEDATARARFAALRDAAGSGLDRADLDAGRLNDWIALSDTLGDVERLFSWIASAPPAALERPEVERILSLRLVPLLVEAERWSDLCRVHPDPIATLRRDHEQLKMLTDREAPPEFAAEIPKIREAMEHELLQRTAALHAALLATDRKGDADALADEAERLFPGPRTEKTLSAAAARVGRA
jgi:thioredoxin-like negative regulator of GroEL